MTVTADKTKVLAADSRALVREGICALLTGCGQIEVVGEAATSNEIIDMVQEHHPDVVLVDAGMLGANGANVVQRIRGLRSDIKVLVLSEYEDREYILTGLSAGGNGYIPNKATAAELVSAILAVHRGDYFLYPSVAKSIVADYLRMGPTRSPDPFDQLSDRERAVLRLIGGGRSSQQIAETLHIAPRTVQGHKARIITKLGIHNQAELIKYTVRKRLITLEE